MPPQDTAQPPLRTRILKYERVEYDDGTRELRVGGRAVAIESKPLAVMKLLLERAPNVVSKDELMEVVWPGVFVEESSITTAVHQLRTALGDDGRELIKTVPRFGYRVPGRAEVIWIETQPPPPPVLQPGQTVQGRPQWRLDAQLGDGTQDAWRGRHGKTGETRVFKFAFTPLRLDALKREAALSRILAGALGRRADIVPVLEWNFDEPPFFIESPYLGDDLAAWAAAQGGLDKVAPALRLDLLARIAQTVADAHGAGVLHGDLKPGNILVGADGQARLIDFGGGGLTEAARQELMTHTLTEAVQASGTQRTGTFLYAAPEMLAGGPPTMKADVYALGILLYQLTVGDLERPLAAGWEKDVTDETLRGLIAEAAQGEPARRLPTAAALAEQLRTLEATRARLAERRAEAAAAAALAEQVLRARQRRPWLILAAASLLLGIVGTGTAALRYARARDEAEHQSRLAQGVNEFLTKDLLGRTNPRISGHAEETLMQAAERAEAVVPARFGRDQDIAAAIYAALATSFQARTAFAQARTAFDNGVRAYRSFEGPDSPHATILRLKRAAMEAYLRTPATLKTASDILAEEEPRLPGLGALRPEAEVALHTAKGMIAMVNIDGATALTEFQTARHLAEAQPGAFDKRDLLRLRYLEGQALIDEYRYGDAAKALAAVAADDAALNGPHDADTLGAQVEEAEALSDVGADAQVVQLVDAIYPSLIDVLGPTHSHVLAALAFRGGSLMDMGQFAGAERDFRTLYEAAGPARGGNPTLEVVGESALGEAECRAGDTTAGTQDVSRALTLASADFGAKSAMAAGVAVFGIECMIKAGQFDAARQALAKVDRTAANTMLNDGYAGETFDLYDAAVAHGLGDDAAARRHLAPLQKYFAANDGNSYHRRWIAELAAALGPQPGRGAAVVTKLPPSAAVH